MRTARLLSSLVLLSGAFLAVAPGARAETARSANGHLVRWDDGLGVMGRRVLRHVPVIQQEVEAALGFAFHGGPAEVIVVSGYMRMREEAGPAVPDWAAGVCVGERSRIVLRADRVHSAGVLASMVTTLRHEWVHLAWARRAGSQRRRLPLWVEEGLAEEIGGGISLDGGMQLDFAATFGRLIPFDEITKSWPRSAERAALAYRQGRSWIRYFRDESGWDHLQRILAALADGAGRSDSPAAGTPFEELVLQYSGLPLSHWTAIWRSQIEKDAEPWFKLIARDFMGTIFFALAVIALIAFGFMRRRRKREIAALPDHPEPGERWGGPEDAGR